VSDGLDSVDVSYQLEGDDTTVGIGCRGSGHLVTRIRRDDGPIR
jgi:hypothetical protein